MIPQGGILAVQPQRKPPRLVVNVAKTTLALEKVTAKIEQGLAELQRIDRIVARKREAGIAIPDDVLDYKLACLDAWETLKDRKRLYEFLLQPSAKIRHV